MNVDITRQRVIELFAGPGGYSEGLSVLGLRREQAVGIEFDADACETAEAAGHRRLLVDVTKVSPKQVACFYFPSTQGIITGFHASPPCQGFSRAGNGKGREDSEMLLAVLDAIAAGFLTVDEGIQYAMDNANDDKSHLSLEPLRWIIELTPEWVTLEQVPAVLPLWEGYAKVLRTWGYSAEAGNVQAEQYGVPQTRKRAIMVASRVNEVSLPVPSHSKFHTRSPQRLDEGVLPWVSMAEALQWGMTERPYPTVAIGGAKGGTDPQAIGGSGARRIIATERAEGRWVEQPEDHPLRDDVMLCPTNLRPNAAALHRLDQPAPTMAFGHETPRWVTPEELAEYRARVAEKAAERVNNQSGTEFDLAWPADRPAPTIAGRGLVTMPGANANRFNGSTKSRNDGLRVTAAEAGALQSFRIDYPWKGGKTSQFQQVGNAVPPLMAARVALAALGCASVSTNLHNIETKEESA